jgi:hypothetical protein
MKRMSGVDAAFWTARRRPHETADAPDFSLEAVSKVVIEPCRRCRSCAGRPSRCPWAWTGPDSSRTTRNVGVITVEELEAKKQFLVTASDLSPGLMTHAHEG